MIQIITQIVKEFTKFLSAKFLSNKYVVQIHDWLKTFINSFKIPSFLSFFILKNGKINPTIDETMAEASPAENNWDRLGLDKKLFGNFPKWALFFLVVMAVMINYWSEIAINLINTFANFMLATFSFSPEMVLPFQFGIRGLIYLIDFLSKFGALVPFAAIFYFMIKSWGKK